MTPKGGEMESNRDGTTVERNESRSDQIRSTRSSMLEMKQGDHLVVDDVPHSEGSRRLDTIPLASD